MYGNSLSVRRIGKVTYRGFFVSRQSSVTLNNKNKTKQKKWYGHVHLSALAHADVGEGFSSRSNVKHHHCLAAQVGGVVFRLDT